MKKVLLTLTVVGVAASVFAQGTVNFNNRNADVRAPIYGPDPVNNTLRLTGNDASGLPAGSTVYAGQLLAGSNFVAQIFAAPGLDASPSQMVGYQVSTFRTGSFAGYIANVTATLTDVPAGGPATAMVRAWDNSSGLYPTWAEARPAWEAGLIAAGESLAFNIPQTGSVLITPPNLLGLRSFNLYLIPEPSTFALAGLGAAALMIFRRRK